MNKLKWLKNDTFPIIPISYEREKGFSVRWLFFTFWTLDYIEFEFAFVCSSHWGIGLIGILPYLRWTITIPLKHIVRKKYFISLEQHRR